MIFFVLPIASSTFLSIHLSKLLHTFFYLPYFSLTFLLLGFYVYIYPTVRSKHVNNNIKSSNANKCMTSFTLSMPTSQYHHQHLLYSILRAYSLLSSTVHILVLVLPIHLGVSPLLLSLLDSIVCPLSVCWNLPTPNQHSDPGYGLSLFLWLISSFAFP